ncbi:hypothetical protein BDZ45DRAFT_769037 [Acephala macrosclerotiorum]|nr:hypothetical protein BDZ45DRAFT_769037 [Acephala macrosclerotiorum]
MTLHVLVAPLGGESTPFLLGGVILSLSVVRVHTVLPRRRLRVRETSSLLRGRCRFLPVCIVHHIQGNHRGYGAHFLRIGSPLLPPATLETKSANQSSSNSSKFIITSISNDFPSNPPSSDTVKKTSKRTNHEANRPEHNLEKPRKRVRYAASASSRTFIDLTCTDSEEEFERYTRDGLYKPSPSPEMFEIVRGEYDGKRMLHKRLKHTTEDRINLPAPALPDSPEGSTKASEDEPSGRRKNPRARVTQRELNDYVDIEKGWLDPSLSRCRKISQFFATQNRLMTSLETLNNEIYTKLGHISADSVPRKTRLELGKELKGLERKRRDLMAELRQAVCDVTMEAASMEQNLEQWHAQENKFTKRIERSR